MGKIFKNLDMILLFSTIFLFIVGLIMVFSSSNVTAYMQKEVSPYYYFIHQGIFLIVGLVLFIIMINFSTKFYGKVSYFLMILFIAILAVLLVVGRAKNQAVSWFELGPVNFQPSEFIKVISIIFLAYYYDKKKKKIEDIKVVGFSLGLCVIAAILIMIQPDLGTAAIYLLIVAFVYWVQPLKKITRFKLFSLFVGAIIVGALALILSDGNILFDRQWSRIENMARPCDRLLSDGNQVCNGYIAMNNGGLFGKGLGNSTQKYLYLPEPYTDFIFTILVEELGAVAGIVLLIFYIIILYRIILIGRRSYTNRGASICYGVAIYIFLHIVINLLGVMGLIPLTGVPLPFISYGGSFTICLIAALTAVQEVAVETKLKDKQKA